MVRRVRTTSGVHDTTELSREINECMTQAHSGNRQHCRKVELRPPQPSDRAMPVPVRDASTILPLRDGHAGLEVFMVKRSSRMGFLGGAHVFPGGAVDPSDATPEAESVLGRFSAARARELLSLDEGTRALGYVVAGIRELYEEAGILLARDGSGEWVVLDNKSDRAERLAALRPRLAAGEVSFVTMLLQEALTVAADSLRYFAHWITPETESKRFDTRFFLAPAPPRQSATHDCAESSEGEWISPAEALDRYWRREIELVPPTICSLDVLAVYGTVAEAMQAAAELEVEEVLPKISLEDGRVAILYPGDPDYAVGQARGEDRGRLLKRLVLRDGLWIKPEKS